MEVFSSEDYSRNLGEFRVVDFTGELQVILKLRRTFIFLPEGITIGDYLSNIPLSFLSKKD